MTAQGRLVFQSCQDPNVFSSARVPTEPAAGSPEAGPVIGIIDGILAADEGRPRNQRHTSKRIFERLRDEHGYSGGITIVEHYVLALRLWHREVFVPLRHDPGHAPVDFGDALAKSRGSSARSTAIGVKPSLHRPQNRFMGSRAES